MKVRIILLFLVITGIMACGPSKSDKLIREAEQRAHDDSVKRSAEDEMKRKVEMKFAITDSINRIGNEISSLTKSIGDIKAELEVQKDKLAGIKEFQFLRSRGEKESQIREKAKEINDLDNLKLELANKLENLLVRLDYFKSESQKYSDS